MIGLDFLLIVVVIAVGLWVYTYAEWLDEHEAALDRRHEERLARINRDLDEEPPGPYDWANEVLDDIDSLPEVAS